MIAFAITDALVTVGAILGIYLLWPHRRDGKVRMIRFGLGFMGFAALIGVIRFASGLMLIAVALLLKTNAAKVDVGVIRYVRYGIPAVVAFLMFFPGTGTIVGFLPMLAFIIGLIASGLLNLHGQRSAGLAWLASFFVIAFASIVVGASRTESTLGITDWHIYHALVGVWAVMVGEATKRLWDR